MDSLLCEPQSHRVSEGAVGLYQLDEALRVSQARSTGPSLAQHGTHQVAARAQGGRTVVHHGKALAVWP
jgi:lipoate-protein ligase A